MSELLSGNDATECTPQSSEGISWSVYAERYDEFVVPMTCYQDNITSLKNFLTQTYDENSKVSACDIGAGTGIFIKSMSEVLPKAEFIHIDQNGAMNEYAAKRYARSSLKVDVQTSAAADVEISRDSLDLVTAINVIYALPNYRERLRDIFRWLKPGGHFFVIDFGRKQNSVDWLKYFFKDMNQQRGFLGTLKAIPPAVNLFRRQSEGAEAQENGEYWLHTTQEFRNSLEAIGFEVKSAESCYRGYADMAVCRKPN